MKLFIHGGLNKTGTSYLQVLLERNTDFLRSQGISYAHSQAGFGNAAQVLYDLRRGDVARLGARLASYLGTAVATGCSSVLLSSELFYHDIVQPAHREILLREINAAGFVAPQLLLFFRDPAAHAVSCYCHRSGIRDTGPFEDWLRDGYEFSHELPLFFSALDDGLGMALTARAYSSGSLPATMAAWLGTPPLPHAVSELVNRSVNAHEARLLSWVRQDDPEAAMRLRRAFKGLDLVVKPPDRALREHWHHVARQSFAPIRAELDKLDALLGAPLAPATGDATTDAADALEDGGDIYLSRAQFDVARAALRPLPFPRRASQRLRRWIAGCRPQPAAPVPKIPRKRG